MEKMEEEISEINGDVKVINEKLDTLLSFNQDQESRIRLLEHSQCPFHQKIEERVDALDINTAISNTKLKIIIGISSSIGAGLVILVSLLLEKIIPTGLAFF